VKQNAIIRKPVPSFSCMFYRKNHGADFLFAWEGKVDLMDLNIIAILMAMLGATSQGLLWAVLAIGVYVAFRILNFADMTSEGSFALGGSVCALLIVGYGWNPFLSLFVSILAGVMAGAVTGILHTKYFNNDILIFCKSENNGAGEYPLVRK